MTQEELIAAMQEKIALLDESERGSFHARAIAYFGFGLFDEIALLTPGEFSDCDARALMQVWRSRRA